MAGQDGAVARSTLPILMRTKPRFVCERLAAAHAGRQEFGVGGNFDASDLALAGGASLRSLTALVTGDAL